MSSGATGLLALTVASAGAVSEAGALLMLALGLGLYARHWLTLANRSRIGARSEDEVRRALASLQSGRVASASLAALAGARRHRLVGNRADRRRIRDRD